MITSGLIVKLEPAASGGISPLAAICSMSSFTIGKHEGDWLSVALEAEDAAASERWHDWIRNLPGVEAVEVVFVHLDDLEVAHVDS